MSSFAGEAAIRFSSDEEGLFGGIAFVVGATSDDALVRGVAVDDADEAEAKHGVGEDVAYKGESAGWILVRCQES